VDKRQYIGGSAAASPKADLKPYPNQPPASGIRPFPDNLIRASRFVVSAITAGTGEQD